MKIVKNTTLSPIIIKDVGGIVIPASGSYTIYGNEYPIWSASVEVDSYITAGTLVINDGYDDLKPVNGIRHIHEEGISRSSALLTTASNIITNNSTLTLDSSSRILYMFTGNTTGQIIQLGDARTYNIGHRYEIRNKSTKDILIKYNDLTTLFTLKTNIKFFITLKDNTTQNGTWLWEDSWDIAFDPTHRSDLGLTKYNVQEELEEIASRVDSASVEFGLKMAFEDFLFDAYAGNNSNDNQYSFTVSTNSGSSDVDGIADVIGNDYEGIHILNSLTSATSRPLVSAFANINRIKLGANQEVFEMRVRIETLADIAQKFTTRYGLMDISTIGVPTNGVIFSYDPIYPVTPIKQVVTVTPIVTSHERTQHFIQTINGTNYDHVYTTNQVITVTPNSFPTATYQQISITWSRANNTTYTVIINGTTCSYTSDATATDAEISAGLSTAINNNVGAVVTATNAKPVVVTSNVLGQAFTYSGTNITITLVTANVPVEVYTQTIAGVPYTFTSDGTPTATEVVTGLKALINADGACPAAASGTTTLILTDKNPPGDSWTYSGTANLTQADTTASTTATGVVTALKILMASDTSVDVAGTTTLIITAKVAGTAFTYSGTVNLTEVLTTANVPEVLYSGNWICSIIKNSTVTPINSEIPVVAGQWYRLKAVVKADGSGVLFFINDNFFVEVNTALPIAAMRYLFKLEKTLGIVSRTTSIDYIAWRRDRG